MDFVMFVHLGLCLCTICVCLDLDIQIFTYLTFSKNLFYASPEKSVCLHTNKYNKLQSPYIRNTF
jgi:hypothetical protein